MKREIAARLLEINRAFYAQMADPFADSRSRPQPGFERLLAYMPSPCGHLLDLGCGEGRFGRFMRQHLELGAYTGVDFTPQLLAKAADTVAGHFLQRDLSLPDTLAGLGQFDAIACLATMQHIPGRENRLRLLQEMKSHLQPGGRLILSHWQFMDSPRQRRKIVDWTEAGIPADELEANDYLLTWKRDGFGLRYVCLIDMDEINGLAQSAGLEEIVHFRSDGKEENLNLYSVLQAK